MFCEEFPVLLQSVVLNKTKKNRAQKVAYLIIEGSRNQQRLNMSPTFIGNTSVTIVGNMTVTIVSNMSVTFSGNMSATFVN